MFKSFKLRKFIWLLSFCAIVVSVPLVAHAQLIDSLAEGQICSPDNSDFNSAYNLARCANNIYLFAVAFGGFYAVLMFVVAGYMYSFGSADSIKKAKDIIRSTVIGLILLFSVYAILNTIDPGLTTFENIEIEQVHCSGEACRIPDFVWEGDVPIGAAPVDGQCMMSFRSESTARGYMHNIPIQVWRMTGNGQRQSHSTSIELQACLVSKTKAAFEAIYNDPNKPPINSIGGFTWRNIQGTRTLSNHSFGLAIDLNPDQNGMYERGRITAGGAWRPCPSSGCSPLSFPANGTVVRAFKAQGMGWGGEWRSKKDYMHFSCQPREGGNCSR
jgi:hypothetical protein